jgi:hypothetical protein
MAAMFLSTEDPVCLPPEARKAVGIFFRYDPKTRKRNGVGNRDPIPKAFSSKASFFALSDIRVAGGF